MGAKVIQPLSRTREAYGGPAGSVRLPVMTGTLREPLLTVVVGMALALAAGTILSGSGAVVLALAVAFLLGAVFRRSPFRVGILLMIPVAISWLFVLPGEGLLIALFALVASAGTGLLLGLAATAGMMAGEAALGERTEEAGIRE